MEFTMESEQENMQLKIVLSYIYLYVFSSF